MAQTSPRVWLSSCTFEILAAKPHLIVNFNFFFFFSIYFSFHQATDEQLFQAARRLVAAELQAITFREFLPALLGGTKHIPPFQGYNSSIDVGISNIMATAALRLIKLSSCPSCFQRFSLFCEIKSRMHT